MSETFQRVYYGSGVPGNLWQDVNVGKPQVIYESADGHFHFHLKAALLTELRSSGGGDVSLPFAKANAGFCLADTVSADAWSFPAPFYSTTASLNCGAQHPDIPAVSMGVSPGWRDVYPSFVPLQWIDVSDVTPGRYYLHSIADPTNVIQEANESNNDEAATDVGVTVPGYVAQPQATNVQRSSRGVPITLAAGAFRSDLEGAPALGASEFSILAAPEHGSLDAPGGQWSPNNTITYIPDPGFHGDDSFVYAVRNSASPAFPTSPSSARISIHVG